MGRSRKRRGTFAFVLGRENANERYVESVPIGSFPSQVGPPLSVPAHLHSPFHRERASFRAAKSKLHAESGQPILLSTKPLRVVVRQSYTDKGKAREAEAWCAESGAVIRRIGLEVRSAPLGEHWEADGAS